ncbi:hypothetical protein K8369_34470 [Streptomyces sp. PSKA30]|nr:hypothetical protein [Streptomyces sp. PSKA30]
MSWMARAAAEESVHRITLLSQSERDLILTRWNDTAREVPAGTLPGLFEAQVARTPDAVAVVFEGTELNYAGSSKLSGAEVSAGPAGGDAVCS